MILISCADNAFGLRFNGRRQSRDRAVSARILARFGGRLWLSEKSRALFPEGEVHVVPSPAQVPPGEGCFWEAPEEAIPERIILYRWNRDYPGDEFFAFPGGADRWEMESSQDFPGYSHERITEEIYIPKE